MDHLDVAKFLCYLAVVAREKDNIDEAQQLFTDEKNMQRRILDDEHIDPITEMHGS